MASRINHLRNIIALNDKELLLKFINKNKINKNLIEDYCYMILKECFFQNKPDLIQTIVDNLCFNGYEIYGSEPYIYLLNNKNMELEVCRWVLFNNKRLTFYYILDNMITFLYPEPGVKEFIKLLRKTTCEKSVSVFEALIDDCDKEKDREILEQLIEFKEKYALSIKKDYVKNFGLTTGILSKYDNEEIKDVLDEETIKKVFQPKEGDEINKAKIDEIILNKDITEKFGENNTIQNIIDAFNKDIDDTKRELIRIINSSLLLEKIRNDDDFFRMLGPLNVRLDVKDTICEFFGGCRMFTCQCYVQTDTGDFPDDEFDVDWFVGYCEFCNIKISKKVHAVRKPVTGGGWSGCYCTFDHAIDSLFYVDVKDKENKEIEEEKINLEDKFVILRMKTFNKQLNEIGVQYQK